MTRQEQDDLVEAIAAKVAEPSFLDMQGMLARRKRAREDADLRARVRSEQRAEIADLIRAFKAGRGLDPLVELERLREKGGAADYDRFCDIADCAAAGYVQVRAIVDLTSNSIPASAAFRAEITALGHEALAARNSAPLTAT